MPKTRAGTKLWDPESAPVEMTADRQLLERYVVQGDEDAFAGLVHRHGRSVWSVCRRFLTREQDAEDAFQATFLILARNARTIRNGQAVGGWLYGVAFRLAMRARQTAARRQEREKKVEPAAPEQSAATDAACRELRRVVDEEVMRLKEKYQAPFVLCCLEGMSKSEAAHELGCSEGTVSGRLARARAILKGRLARRGFTLSAALTVVALMHSSASAAPAGLAQATADAVLATESGAGGLSQAVLDLAQDFARPSRMTPSLALLAFLLALLVSIGSSMLAVGIWQLSSSPANGSVQVIEPETFVPPGVAMGTPVGEQVLTVAFSPDGKNLLTAGAWGDMPGQLKIWDADTAKEKTTVSRLPGVRSAAFSPDGTTIATGDFSGALTLRDAVSTDEFSTVKAHAGGVNSVAYSFDGTMLASAGLDGTAKLWRASDLKALKVFAGHAGRVLSVAVFRDGQAIVTGGQDGTAKIWDVNTGKELFMLKNHLAGIEMVAVSPDDAFIATASTDKTVRLWDRKTGAEIAALEGDQPFLTAAFSPDGVWLAAAGRSGAIELWDVKTRQRTTLEGHKEAVWALAFSSNGVLASGSADRTAKFWPIRGKGQKKTMTTSWSSTRPVRAAVYSPRGDILAVATNDKTVHLRDVNTGDIIRVLHGHTAPVNCLAFSPDGKILASGSDDLTLKTWAWDTGDEINTFAGHGGPVQALTFTRDGNRLISAGDDATIRIWDAASGAALASLQGHTGAVLALAISPDGQTLCSGGADAAIKTWDLNTQVEVRSLPGHRGAVRALTFSSDGALASASDDKAVKVWDAATGAERFTLNGHTLEVLALAFSPKGQTLVSAGRDKIVRVWDPATGQLRGYLKGHNDAVRALTIHPHGKNLVSGSRDTLLFRWQAGKLVPQRPDAPADANPPAKQNVAIDESDRPDEWVGLQDSKPKDDGAKRIDEKPQQLVKEIFRSFKDKANNRQGLELIGPDASKCVRFEAEGLRIALPTGYKGERPKTGVLARTPLKGDFEITVDFEILQEPEREDTGKDATRLSLSVDFADAARNEINFSRRMGMPNGAIMVAWSSHPDEKTGKDQVDVKLFSSPTKPGRMRLTRSGAEVTFWVSDSADVDFVPLQTRRYSERDVRGIRISGCTANEKAALGVRVTDLRIRAADFPKPAPTVQPKPQPTVAPRDQNERLEIQFKKGLEAQPNLRLFGPDAANLIKADAQGLRFTMPAGRDSGNEIGVESKTRILGDFEITLAYELLALPDPPPELGAGAVLQVHFDTPDDARARLARTIKTKGPLFGSNFMTRGPDGKDIFKGLNYPPADGNILTGRLRLTRAGDMVAYQVEEGGTGFRTIATYRAGAVDVTSIRAIATTGWQPIGLDMRFTTLEIRCQPQTSSDVVQPPPAAPPETPTANLAGDGIRIWLGLAIVLGLGAGLLFAIGFALWFFMRKRPAARKVTGQKKPAASSPANAVLVFPCPACSKSLKVKSESAGKKAKCPHCGKIADVPKVNAAKKSGASV